MATKERLIDADKLLSEIHHYDKVQKSDVWLTEDIEYLLKEQPTVEAVEVVHGRWITDQVEAFNPFTEEPYPLDVLQCSVCGEYFDVSEARNYCPNCGAKMDGDGNG